MSPSFLEDMRTKRRRMVFSSDEDGEEEVAKVEEKEEPVSSRSGSKVCSLLHS